MKPVFIAVFATTLLSAAPYAFAQPGGDIRDREDQLEHRIERSRDERRIGPDQADHAFHELHRIRDEEADMRDRHHGHLDDDERSHLQDRLAELDREVDQMREARNSDPDAPHTIDPGRALDQLLNQH